jgi:hypothetical protein
LVAKAFSTTRGSRPCIGTNVDERTMGPLSLRPPYGAASESSVAPAASAERMVRVFSSSAVRRFWLRTASIAWLRASSNSAG